MIDYPDRDATYTGACQGTPSHNGIYGHGLVALRAAQLRGPGRG